MGRGDDPPRGGGHIGEKPGVPKYHFDVTGAAYKSHKYIATRNPAYRWIRTLHERTPALAHLRFLAPGDEYSPDF